MNINVIFCLFALFASGCATLDTANYNFMPSKESRLAYLDANPVTDPLIKNAVENGKIVLGMTAEQVRATYGEPCVSTNKGHEVWVYAYYGRSSYRKSYVCVGNERFMFKDGRVAYLNEYDFDNAYYKEKEAREKLEKVNKKREYIKKRSGLSEAYKKAILQSEIMRGMTSDDVEVSWGKPKDINRSVGSWGVHEQWIYGSSNYLYFKNGILDSWQN